MLNGRSTTTGTSNDRWNDSASWSDATFDAAYLVATLGEVPDRDTALRELRRVLKPGGRLVVGEGQPGPHMIQLDDLRRQAERAGLRFELSEGTRLGYLARFRAG